MFSIRIYFYLPWYLTLTCGHFVILYVLYEIFSKASAITTSVFLLTKLFTFSRSVRYSRLIVVK